jgi:ribonuclease P protein component
MTQSLSRDQRIRKRRVFDTLFKKGRFFRGKFLRAWILKNPEGAKQREIKPQMGVIVSRKTDLRATKRNLWKRRIREAFRKNQAKIKNNMAILIQATRNPLAIPSIEMIQTELLELLEKAGCLKK